MLIDTISCISCFAFGILMTLIFQVTTTKNEERQIRHAIKKIKRSTLHEKAELKRVVKHFIDSL